MKQKMLFERERFGRERDIETYTRIATDARYRQVVPMKWISRPLVYTIEAARVLSVGLDAGLAVDLLRAAIQEIEGREAA